MYRVGKRAKNKRKQIIRWLAVLSVVAVVVIAGVLLVGILSHPKTDIKQSNAVVQKFTVSSSATHTYDEGLFTIALPGTWSVAAGEKQPYDIYRWKNPASTTDDQQLEVYVDTIPQNFAVNRVLAVENNGDQVTALGTVSDNCADFTKAASSSAQTGTIAKWQGITFLCDLNNYERDVVGTSSETGINSVTAGSGSDIHTFFFTYTDNNINPDYTVFYNALSSFRLK